MHIKYCHTKTKKNKKKKQKLFDSNVYKNVKSELIYTSSTDLYTPSQPIRID